MIKDDKKMSTSFGSGNSDMKLDEVIEAPDNMRKAAISREKIGGEPQMMTTEILEGVLYSGFFGTLDTSRLQRITEAVLDRLFKSDTEIIIIDLSNVDVIDSAVAVHLIKFSETIFTIGCKTIFCGIKPIIAQTMSMQDISVRKLAIEKNLKAAFREVLKYKNLELVSKNRF